MVKKLNDIKYGGISAPSTLQLNKAQLKGLSKDQLEGRTAVHIMGVEGYRWRWCMEIYQIYE